MCAHVCDAGVDSDDIATEDDDDYWVHLNGESCIMYAGFCFQSP